MLAVVKSGLSSRRFPDVRPPARSLPSCPLGPRHSVQVMEIYLEVWDLRASKPFAHRRQWETEWGSQQQGFFGGGERRRERLSMLRIGWDVAVCRSSMERDWGWQ